MTTNVRKVGEVAKVPVFQHRSPNISYDPNGNPLIQNDKAFTDGPHELTLAYTPGLFVIGTNKSSVGHAIKRFLGEEKGGGLGGTAAFKEAAAAAPQDRPVLLRQLSRAQRSPTHVEQGSRRRAPAGAGGDLRSLLAQGSSSDIYRVVQPDGEPEGSEVSGRLCSVPRRRARRDDRRDLRPRAEEPSVGVPLRPRREGRNAASRTPPGHVRACTGLPEKNRAAAVIGFLDAIAKANGELGRLPRDIVKELGAKHKLDVAEALIGKVQTVTVVMPAKQELPKGGKPGPMFVFQTADAAAAAAWEEFLPKLIGELAGAAFAPQQSAETINGVKVFTVPGAGLRWNAPVHFARDGAVVAVGLDRKLVAAAVVAECGDSVVGGR